MITPLYKHIFSLNFTLRSLPHPDKNLYFAADGISIEETYLNETLLIPS